MSLLTLTKTSIKNILDAAEIKPFRIQYYCEKRDPDFEAKIDDTSDVERNQSIIKTGTYFSYLQILR